MLKHHAAEKFFVAVVEQARSSALLSSEHFSVDGTLIDAWASLKSFRPKDESPSDRDPPDDKGNPSVSFHGETRTNDTHASTTDPEAKLVRKGAGKEARLSFAGHALMENRNGLLVDLRLTEASGVAERETAIAMLDATVPGNSRVTLGADAGFTTQGFLDACRARNVTPHVALKRKAASPIDGRTTRHKGYALSQRALKRSEPHTTCSECPSCSARIRHNGSPPGGERPNPEGASFRGPPSSPDDSFLPRLVRFSTACLAWITFALRCRVVRRG